MRGGLRTNLAAAMRRSRVYMIALLAEPTQTLARPINQFPCRLP